MTPKVLVLGLDGASFNLIQPWLNDNTLPNIKQLINNGVSGEMESCIPPITCPNWRCYSTGKNPGKLGVFWWEHINVEKKKVIIPNSNSFESADLWDYLNKAGIKTGIIGMPMTYPPRHVDGFMIAGGPDAEEEGYTCPTSLQKELECELNYRIQENIDLSSNVEESIKNIINLININFDAAEYLLRKYSVDFLHLTSFHINGPLQHFFYDSEPTRKAWKLVDQRLSELQSQFNFDYVVVMSDHGTSPMVKNWFINAWLREQGYLKLKRSQSRFVRKQLGICKTTLIRVAKYLNIYRVLKNLKPLSRISQALPNQDNLFGDREGKIVMQLVDWQNTSAVGSPQGPIYINRSLVKDKHAYENLRKELISKLEALMDPDTGEKPIEMVYKREEIYEGKYVDLAPDLIALDADKYHNRGGILKTSIFGKSKWRGNNSKKGLFIASGIQIKNNMKISDIKILDLAPTILRIFGVRIPEDMDGRVLKEIFTDDSALAQKEVAYQKSIRLWHRGSYKNTEREVRERLKGLGYLD